MSPSPSPTTFLPYSFNSKVNATQNRSHINQKNINSKIRVTREFLVCFEIQKPGRWLLDFQKQIRKSMSSFSLMTPLYNTQNSTIKRRKLPRVREVQQLDFGSFNISREHIPIPNNGNGPQRNEITDLTAFKDTTQDFFAFRIQYSRE